MNTRLVLEVPPVTTKTFHKPSQEQKKLNDKHGLAAIHRFGWLRAREIGNILWCESPTRHIAGATIARRWVKDRLVMSRTLPWGMGLAFVLTKRGADYLENEFGIEAKSGKKIGDHIDQIAGVWRPSNSWQHDLIANSFLSLCLGEGHEVRSELELSRKFPNAKKIPDGLWKMPDTNQWVGIEVERANKWSTAHRQLIDSLIETQVHGLQLGEILVRNTCLVYADPTIRNPAGESPADHFKRAERAAEARVPTGVEFKLIGVPVKLHNGAVIEITEPISKVIGESYAARLSKSVYGHKWHDGSQVDEPTSKFSLQFKEPKRPFSVHLKKLRGNEWNITIYPIGNLGADQEIRLNTGPMTETAAKRMALSELVAMPAYIQWFDRQYYQNMSIDDL